MLSFGNDYSYGACPEILDRLARTNDTAFPGYGRGAAAGGGAISIRRPAKMPSAGSAKHARRPTPTCGSSSAARRPTRP